MLPHVYLTIFGGTSSASGSTVSLSINLSASQDIDGAPQSTAIGTISGGTGPYTVTDPTNTTQVASGNLLQVGSVAPSVGTITITLHDTGVPAAPDANFTISTVPQAPSLALDSGSDSGSSNSDKITNVNTPNLIITFPTTPVAGDLAILKDGGSTIISHTITSGEISGQSINLASSALADGVHSLTAVHSRSGLASAASTALSVTIDTAAPTLSSPTGAQDGTTSSQADISVSTNDGTGTMWWIISTSATPPSVAQIQAGQDSTGSAAAKSGSAAVSASGVQSFTASSMTNGTYFSYFQQRDVAGNDSAVSASASWVQTLSTITPVQTLQSPASTNTPWFDFDGALNLATGDTIEIQYGTDPTFSTHTSVVTTLTNQQASFCVLDLAQPALTNATTYYFRSRYTQGGNTSAWSNTSSYTVATVSVPTTPTASAAGAMAAYDTTNTYPLAWNVVSNVDLGTPDAGRNIIVAAGGITNLDYQNAYILTDKNIAAGNYLGTLLTKRVSCVLTSSRSADIWSGVVATGRSGRVIVTCESGAAQVVGACVMNAYGLSSGTPTATDHTNSSAVADPFNIGAAVTIPSGGFAIAAAFVEGTFTSRAWRNNYSEIKNSVAHTSEYLTVGLSTTAGSSQASLNRGNFNQTEGVVAVWN